MYLYVQLKSTAEEYSLTLVAPFYCCSAYAAAPCYISQTSWQANAHKTTSVTSIVELEQVFSQFTSCACRFRTGHRIKAFGHCIKKTSQAQQLTIHSVKFVSGFSKSVMQVVSTSRLECNKGYEDPHPLVAKVPQLLSCIHGLADPIL